MVYGCAYAAISERDALTKRCEGFNSSTRFFSIRFPLYLADSVLQLPQLLPAKCRSFADSKTLTEDRRTELLADIKADNSMGYAYESLDARAISSKMLQRYDIRPCLQHTIQAAAVCA